MKIETLKALAEKNNWVLKPKRRLTKSRSCDFTKTETHVTSEKVTLLTNGNPIPWGTEGMTDAIRKLAELGEKADEADEENRDYGYELYRQYELNGGRESEYYGCTHPEGVYVADGHKGRITTGNTLVWDFCTECGNMIGDGPSEFYSTVTLTLNHCTKYHPNDELEEKTEYWTELASWEVEPTPYEIPKFLSVEEATPMIRRAINRR